MSKFSQFFEFFELRARVSYVYNSRKSRVLEIYEIVNYKIRDSRAILKKSK